MTYLQKLKKIPNYIAILLITVYRWIFSPSVGILRFLPFYPKHVCIFYPTCSEYGLMCFEKMPFFKALYKTIHRIHRCNPKNTPRVDMPFVL